MSLLDRHNTQIESQSQHSLENAYRKIVDEEIELESKLKILAEVKAKVWIEIEKRINKNNYEQ